MSARRVRDRQADAEAGERPRPRRRGPRRRGEEVRGKKNPLTPVGLRNLREEHAKTIAPARDQAAEVLRLERQFGRLVNDAYGLTADEVELLWRTAPPRMPFP